jgi:hypothetical protein
MEERYQENGNYFKNQMQKILEIKSNAIWNEKEKKSLDELKRLETAEKEPTWKQINTKYPIWAAEWKDWSKTQPQWPMGQYQVIKT